MAEDARTIYDEICSALTAMTEAAQGKMFGMPCLKIGSKVFAGFYRDAMIFKLSGATHAQALALPGAHLFDPGGMGRAMKEWVVVPAEHANSWMDYAGAALSYVGGV